MMYFKILAADKSTNGGEYTWSLPTKNDDGTWTPGEWTEPIEGALVACENGYHLAKDAQLMQWLGPHIYEAEGDELTDHGDKYTARRVRLLRKIETWNDRTARLFAVWCAREALKLIDEPDPRSIDACNVAERYANGEATDEELATAWATSCDATWTTACDATWATAWGAARDAAWAAWAVGAAARAAQYKILLEMLGEK